VLLHVRDGTAGAGAGTGATVVLVAGGMVVVGGFVVVVGGTLEVVVAGVVVVVVNAGARTVVVVTEWCPRFVVARLDEVLYRCRADAIPMEPLVVRARRAATIWTA